MSHFFAAPLSKYVQKVGSWLQSTLTSARFGGFVMSISCRCIYCRTTHVLDGLVIMFVNVVPLGVGFSKVSARVSIAVRCFATSGS